MYVVFQVGTGTVSALNLAELATALAATATLIFGVLQYYKKKRSDWLGDIIDGTKESAVVAALRIRHGERDSVPRRWHWPGWRKRRLEEIEALCLASVFEKSGRARALIHDALRKVPKDSER